jgi:hypothetical protein
MTEYTPELLMEIAEEVGYETDNEGQVVIYTGLYECQEHGGLFDDNPGKDICKTCENWKE